MSANKALPVVLALVAAGTLATAANAAVPLAFPADPKLVPLAVGAAFALPAILALGASTLMRLLGGRGPLRAVFALAVVGILLASGWSLGLLQIAG